MRSIYLIIRFSIIFTIAICLLKPSYTFAEYTYPRNNKILLYAPGYDNFDQKQIYDHAINFFDGAEHYEAEVIGMKNRDASVQLVTRFGEYGTVLIQTHGWNWIPPTGPQNPQPGFRTGTIGLVEWMPTFEWPTYTSDLLFNRLVLSKKPDGSGVYQYVVLPEFVKAYVYIMRDTFLYLGYCHSLQNEKMWDAFKERGAKVAIGWSDEFHRDEGVDFFDELMRRMLPDNITIDPFTLSGAMDDIDDLDKQGETEDGRDSFADYKVASSEWENFIYLDPKPFVLVTISDVSGTAFVFVWDLEKNQYAEITDNDDNIIEFPTNKENISTWLGSTVPVGDDLYTLHGNCNDKSLFESLPNWVEPTTVLPDDSCNIGQIPDGSMIPDDTTCYGHNDSLQKTSYCSSVYGETLDSEVNLSSYRIYHRNGNYTNCLDGLNIKEAITRNWYEPSPGMLQSVIINISNNINDKTSFRVENIERRYEHTYVMDSIYLYQLNMLYNYKLISPIGQVASWEIYNKSYDTQMNYPEQGVLYGDSFTEEIVSTKQFFKGRFSNNAIVQLFTAEALKRVTHLPCGPTYSGWPSDCQVDYIAYEPAQEFAVLATADLLDDAENQDPRLLTRNELFESAIYSLHDHFIMNFQHESSLPDYDFNIEIRE